MNSTDKLAVPFTSWQEALLALANDLRDPTREKLITSRVEATAARIGVTDREICALALLVPCGARFDRRTVPKHTPNPLAVELAGKITAETQKTMSDIFDAHEKFDDQRQKKVFLAFAESDPRRIFSDTILGFAAAELSDFSQKLGQADPFSQLARRLSLWFKPFLDFSRYGVACPEDGQAVVKVVLGLVELLDDKGSPNFKKLVRIWAGDLPVEASEEGLRQIKSFVTAFERSHFDGILALEILGGLADDIDLLDLDALGVLSQLFGSLHRIVDDGRPGTADFRTWIKFGMEEANVSGSSMIHHRHFGPPCMPTTRIFLHRFLMRHWTR